MVVEQWRPVLDPRFSAAYQASDMGRIRSVTRQVAGRTGRDGVPCIRTVKGRILSPRVRPNDGTRAVNLWIENDYIQFPVKRLVLEAFTGRAQPPGYDARNIDDDPANNKLSNLRWEPVGGLALLQSRLGR
jgi:hypothetical protein